MLHAGSINTSARPRQGNDQGTNDMRKPDNIIHGTEDRPPVVTLLPLAVQHMLVLSIFLVAPVIVAKTAHLPNRQAGDFISLTMIALAISTVLQVRRWGPIGCGLLAIPTSSSNWVPGCVIAVHEGGWPMVEALLFVAAGFEMLLSPFLRRLRGLLPTELSGLVVLVTGLGVAQTGMNNIVAGITAGNGVAWLPSLLVSTITLGVMVGLSVWGRGPVRTLAAGLGLVCGYVASLASGLADSASLNELAHVPLLRVPSVVPALPSIEASVLPAALITGLAVTLNTIGALTAAQKLNDADWNRQDLPGLSRGVLADGLGTMISAFIGGGGVSASGVSVSLAANARTTSRTLGYAVAAAFLVLSMVPGFALAVLSIPPPVLGSVLVFLSCALVISGMSIMSSRLLDTRKTFTLGIAFAFAVASSALVQAGDILPYWMSPVITSPLLASALVAILLNPVLRLGIRQQVELAIPQGGLPHDEIARFITRAGAAWGARRDVIDRAQGVIAECLDALADAELAAGEGHLILGFNELHLDARITWSGAPLVLSASPPSKQELLTDDTAAARMAGFLIARLASRVTSRVVNGLAELHLVFEH
jgi:xanthine permease XanP